MRKHIAKISTISPKLLTTDELIDYKAYCCVSLSNPNFFGKRLPAIMEFLEKYTKNPIVIVAGYLYRLHYRLFCDCDESALEYANQAEKKYIDEQLHPCLIDMGLGDVIQISRWFDYYQTEAFQDSLKGIWSFYQTNNFFSQAINQIAQAFVTKQQENNELALPTDQAVEYSIQFLLEETALFNTLALQGYPVDVYPGVSLSALKRFDEQNMAVPKGLKQRISVELTIHRLGRKPAKERYTETAVTY